jgi:hypothetical protein
VMDLQERPRIVGSHFADDEQRHLLRRQRHSVLSLPQLIRWKLNLRRFSWAEGCPPAWPLLLSAQSPPDMLQRFGRLR